MSADWSSRAIRIIGGWQERAYGQIGEQMGIGFRPAEVYRMLVPPPPPQGWTEAELDRSMPAEFLTHVERSTFSEVLGNYMDKYVAEPSTPYESPTFQAILRPDQELLLSTLEEIGLPLPRPVVLATLPTGQVNARSRRIRGSDEIAILFEHGLMHYLYLFSFVVGFAVPANWWAPLVSEGPNAQISSLVARLGQEETKADPRAAATHLGRLVQAYVIDGNPRAAARPRVRGAMLVASSVLRQIRLFIVAHELMHVALGHLEISGDSISRADRWEREFDADINGASLAASCFGGPPTVLGLWSCHLALIALDFVERAVTYLDSGSIDCPGTDTHPPSHERASALIRYQVNALSENGRSLDALHFAELVDRSGALMEQAWSATKPAWDDLRSRGTRPSPLWWPRPDPTLDEKGQS
jgi:hypothetical protein